MAEKKGKTFAALDVGSFEICMKIYEITKSGGLKQIEHVRHRLALGTDSYASRKISAEKMEELFRILQEFRRIMKGYRVEDMRAYGTSALRETDNTEILLDQIKNRSGVSLNILSNSEQRFLDYKAIAAQGEQFDRIIGRETAIVDIGGGSIQISLFDKDRLITTQSLKLGVLRLHERLLKIQPRSMQIEGLLDEMIGGQLHVFQKMYMKDRKVQHLILMDDYLSPKWKEAIPGVSSDRIVSAQRLIEFTEGLNGRSEEELSDELEIPEENVSLLKLSAGILKRILLAWGAEEVWAPGATLCDGIAYEYAQERGLKIAARDFEKDIIASAGTISRRYMGSRKRSAAMEEIALAVFEGCSESHGMGNRERLLLRLAAILHDCGKFINMTNVGECSHAIIMNTEIIGLSHREREMVAYIVKFNHDPFEYYEELGTHTEFEEREYLVIAKLTAILRIANALDKSQKQKVRSIEAQLKDNRLIVTVDAGADLLFESERFAKHAAFFEEVYGIRPVIRKKG